MLPFKTKTIILSQNGFLYIFEKKLVEKSEISVKPKLEYFRFTTGICTVLSTK